MCVFCVVACTEPVVTSGSKTTCRLPRFMEESAGGAMGDSALPACGAYVYMLALGTYICIRYIYIYIYILIWDREYV
jgi:hypothetical protein